MNIASRLHSLADRSRRNLLKAGCLALACGATTAWAQFPEKAIRVIVPFTAGGATDMVGRILADELGKVLNTSTYVDNRDGAAGVIGVQVAAQAPADGYTVIIAGNSLYTSHPTLYPKLPYDPQKDFEPVSRVASGSHIIIVRPDSPYKDVKGLIQAAAAKPEGVTYGSGGKGTSVHLAAEMFQLQAGVKFLHVPYRGTSLAVTGLISGDTDLIFDTTASAFPRIKAGQVRALGLTSKDRDPELPDTPTVAEQGLPEYEVLFWLGLYAPKGTPADVLKTLDQATKTVLAQDSVRERLAATGVKPYYASGPELKRQVAEETVMWADVIRKAGVTFD